MRFEVLLSRGDTTQRLVCRCPSEALLRETLSRLYPEAAVVWLEALDTGDSIGV